MLKSKLAGFGPVPTSVLIPNLKLIERFSLSDVGVDPKLSARSQKIGGIGEQAFEAVVDSMRQRIADGGRVSLDIASADKKRSGAQSVSVIWRTRMDLARPQSLILRRHGE